MSRKITGALLLAVLSSQPITASASSLTGVTGGGQPFDNTQPSVAMTYFVPLTGIFPSGGGGGGALEFTMGSVRLFASNFAPGDSLPADGALLPISQNTALFSLLRTTFGGDGKVTFAMPDLRNRTTVHAGTGPGLSTWSLGEVRGSQQVTLTEAQVPSHAHTLPPPHNATGITGGFQPFENTQPSMALNYVIATDGIFPSPTSGSPGPTLIGQVGLFAGNFEPGGWMFADGRLLDISQHDTLFQLIGTTYGGDGQTTFALPDLRGRTPIHAGSGPRQVGQTTGTESVTLTQNQMPAHDHTLPPSVNVTGPTGGGQPIDNMQPSLALNYIIALQGIFPPSPGSGGITGEIYLGEVTLFAGNFAPRGWAFANGQLLPINQNQALFSLLGTQYGGDGQTTFALPDLRGGRTVIHRDSAFAVGNVTGSNLVTLTQANLPAHAHTHDIPEPATVALLAGGLLAALRRTRLVG